MTPLLRAFLLSTAVPAVAATLLLLGHAPATAGDPVLMLVLVALGAIAAHFPIMVAPRYKADASPAIDLALVLMADSAWRFLR